MTKGSMTLDERVLPSATGSTVPLTTRREGGFPIRHVQALLLFGCFFVAYFLRSNLSVAIVAMTDTKRDHPDFEEYAWDQKVKSKVLSSFFWGYLIIQVPAGLMGQTISPKKLLIITNTLCAILTLVIPIATHYGGWMALCIIRVLQGLCQGFYVPLTYTLASKWVPVNEQNRFIGFTLNGGTLGATAVSAVAGFLAGSAAGWPSIFYVSGVLGLLWVVVWMYLGADSPTKHKSITEYEKELIQTSLQNNSDVHIPVPWFEIFTSAPIWALTAAHIGCGWAFSIIFTQMPTYISSVLGFDIESNGLLSAIPYLVMWVVSYFVFWLADSMNEREVFSTTTLRKIWATIAGSAAAATLIGVSFVGQNAILAMVLLVIAVSLSSCAFSGVYVNPLDLAPNFAGVLTGIGNGLENISSILAPLSVGWILNDETSLHDWRMVFLLAVIVDVSGNIIFLIWGSAKLQPWNEPKVKKPLNTNEMTSSPPYNVSS